MVALTTGSQKEILTKRKSSHTHPRGSSGVKDADTDRNPNVFRPRSTRSSHYYAASTETKLHEDSCGRDLLDAIINVSRREKPTIYIFAKIREFH